MAPMSSVSLSRQPWLHLIGVIAALAVLSAAPDPPALDRDAERWVQRTLKQMTLDEQIGQLLAPSINSLFTSVDSDVYDKAVHLVRDLKVGALHVFGGAESMPQALLNPTYSGSSVARKGDPFAAAALLNRLQREAAVPLLTTADFEGGVGYILNGGTRLPRAMAIAATRDTDLAFLAGRLSALEGRSLGVHINFYPVVDVNNNPRNPIINIRSFGEDVGLVSEMATAYVRGIEAGGMLSTAKHFPGHGDTSVDTHLALPIIEHPRDRLDKVELPPFKAAVQAGVSAVMSSHIGLPALDPSKLEDVRPAFLGGDPGQPARRPSAESPATGADSGPPAGVPATLSRRILTGLLRDEMGFKGLIFTDSMSMFAIAQNFTPGEAAVMAVRAGADFVLHSPDDDAAVGAIKLAVEKGEIDREQIARSAERILRAKARLGLHKKREVDLAAIDAQVGGREHQRLAAHIAERALTLLKDERNAVPLPVARTARVLYLSVIDYASGWREGAPSRAIIPALRERWPNLTAIEISDKTSANELDLVRVLARQVDAVVAGVFVRIASYSGRMDLSPAQVSLLEGLGGQSRPFVAVLFGNPYVPTFMPKLPAMLLTYETTDSVEVAAARALAGEVPIRGKLPITLPDMFPFGHGLERPAATGTSRP